MPISAALPAHDYARHRRDGLRAAGVFPVDLTVSRHSTRTFSLAMPRVDLTGRELSVSLRDDPDSASQAYDGLLTAALQEPVETQSWADFAAGKRNFPGLPEGEEWETEITVSTVNVTYAGPPVSDPPIPPYSSVQHGAPVTLFWTLRAAVSPTDPALIALCAGEFIIMGES